MANSFYTAAESATCVVKPLTKHSARKGDAQSLKELK